MRSVFYFLLSLFCYASAITSNSIFSIPVKTLLFLALVICLSAEFYTRRVSCKLSDIILLGMLVVFLCIWGTLGLLNGYEASTFQHAIKVVTVFGLFMLFKLVVDSDYLGASTVLKLLDRMFYLAIIAKLGFESLYITGVMSGNSLVELLRTVFSLNIMQLSIADGYLLRMGAIIDVLPLSIFPFILIRKNGVSRYALLLLVAAYTLINFSRVYILQAIVLTILALMPLHSASRKLKFILGGTLAISLLFAIMPDDFYLALTGRFIGVNADASDLVRVTQTEYFLAEIPNAPLLGNGLGAYLSGFVRGYEIPFLYEMEYLALIFQCGILGLLFIAILFYLMVRSIRISQLDTRLRLLIYANILFFIFRPLTNPMLFASSSVMVLIYMFVLSRATLERS